MEIKNFVPNFLAHCINYILSKISFLTFHINLKKLTSLKKEHLKKKLGKHFCIDTRNDQIIQYVGNQVYCLARQFYKYINAANIILTCFSILFVNVVGQDSSRLPPSAPLISSRIASILNDSVPPELKN